MVDEGIFTVFKNHWEISAEIVLESPVRIGAQNWVPYSTHSAPLLRQYDVDSRKFEVFIPGSSLKGVIRHNVERLFASFNVDPKNAEHIFGSTNRASKVKVRDAHVFKVSSSLTDSRIQAGMPNISSRKETPWIYKTTIYIRDVEFISPGVRFKFKATLDNASEHEVKIFIEGIREFNRKRAFIGGGCSRGFGFCKFENIDIKKYELDVETLDINTNTQVDIEQISFKDAISTYTHKKDGPENDGMPFNKYYYGNNKGIYSCEFEMIPQSKLRNIKIYEDRIWDGDVIPGSMIKGAIRHAFIWHKFKRGIRPPIKRITKKEFDDFFGDSRNHASRIIISDFVKANDGVYKGHIVLFNVDLNEYRHILSLLGDEIILTGKRAANGQKYNKVIFKLIDAWKFSPEEPDLNKNAKSEVNNVIIGRGR